MATHADPSVGKEAVLLHSQAKYDKGEPIVEQDTASTAAECPWREQMSSFFVKGKDTALDGDQKTTRPLYLQDLPDDILRLIVKEVTHTNDLTALALTSSILYNLAVPHIYARFDIVWPETAITTSESKSVDALTYGLATLCLGSKFAQRTRWLRGRGTRTPGPASGRLVNNQYATFTRKFSLGNGPPDWVAEYSITKESGKMLGTLVAVALAKMVNLETFVWDMPTGTLSDVFMSLASLQDLSPDGESKLDKVWIRWHDNSEPTEPISTASSPVVTPTMAVGIGSSTATPLSLPSLTSNMLPPVLQNAFHQPGLSQLPRFSDSRVEFPTFSVLPALKSLTVLEIDELAYLDEMSYLVERSRDKLQELRIGVSEKAAEKDFTKCWDGPGYYQVDLAAQWPGESSIGERRLGGILGVVLGRVFDLRQKGVQKSSKRDSLAFPSAHIPGHDTLHTQGLSYGLTNGDADLEFGNAKTTTATPKSASNGAGVEGLVTAAETPGTRLDGKLKVATLELERLALSVPVCCKAFDWSVLTSITILQCKNDAALWKALRRQVRPVQAPDSTSTETQVYHTLGLRKIHTDHTTAGLISFIKEGLAPNSLEVLFLQDRRRSGPPAVSIEDIFRGAIRKHRSSLKKLLLDSSEEGVRQPPAENSRWRNWVLTSEMVAYMTSGRMPRLKELAVAMHYNDWHPFLQRLEHIPQLRSMHIPYLQDRGGVSELKPNELALQVVDIITLRPEVQLCYLGLATKCYEIQELKWSGPPNGGPDPYRLHSHQHDMGAISVVSVSDEEDEEDDSEVDDTEDEEDDQDGDEAAALMDDGDDHDEASDDGVSVDSFQQDAERGARVVRLRLREILFYDDKVAIFKARHGRL